MSDTSRSRASSTSHDCPAPRTETQGFQLLPLLTKHYKTALLLLLVWLIGYLGLSTTWVLIGFFFYVVNKEYQKVKHAKRSFAQEAGVNEKQAILARVDELPAWVYFPDIERAEWLNKMIHQLWPYIGDYVKKMLHDTVEPIVDGYMPGSFKPFKFEHIDLGDTPPRIGGVKVYSENVRRDEVIMDLEIFYAGDAEVKVAVRGMNAGIKHLTIHGTVRVVFKPLVPVVPLIGGLNVFFLNTPSVDFDLTNFANLLDTPLLSNTLRGVIMNVISSFLVLPNKIPIQLVNDIDVTNLKFPMPQGVLRLHVVAARELKKADNKLLGKSSDPYVKLFVGAQEFKTNVIQNNIAPVWNKYFEAVVDQKFGQVVDFDVYDEDTGKDDELGTASLNIENVANQGFVDSWLPLENVSTGMIHIRALWFHLSKDPEDLDREKSARMLRARKDTFGSFAPVGKSLMDGANTQCEEHLASALLIITVDSAKNLPRGKKAMSEPSPFVNVGVGNIKRRSLTKPKTTDPRFEETFQFMVHNPRVQELYLELLDGKKTRNKSDKDGVSDSGKSDKKLGYVNFPIKNLMTAKDMTVHRPFQLQGSAPSARITLRITLRILTSEKPAEWATDSSEADRLKTAEKVATPDPGSSVDDPVPASSPPSAPASASPSAPASAPGVAETGVEEVIRPEAATHVEASPDMNENEKHFTLGGDSDGISNSSSTGAERSGSELRHRGTSLASSLAPFGRIQLTIRYASNRKRLICVVHQCTNLIPCDEDQLADPYVKIYLRESSSSKRKTQVVKNNLNPLYDETFEWNVSHTEAQATALDVTVKNSTGFLSRSQKIMGQVTIVLGRFEDISKSSTNWYDLDEPTDSD